MLLTSLHSRDLVEGTHITLNFLLREYEGGVSGSMDCNSYGGPYTVASQGRFRLLEISSTARGCGGEIGEQEDLYLETLGEVVAYWVAEDRLEMKNASGETTLVFERKPEYPTNPADLIGTVWQLATINDQPAEGVVLTFHTAHVVSWHAECRYNAAAYTAAGDDIWFYPRSMDKTDCPDPERAQRAPAVGVAPSANIFLQEEQLTFFFERGAKAVYVPLPDKQDAALIGTEWRLTSFVSKLQDTTHTGYPLVEISFADGITAIFEEGTVHGSAGERSYEVAYQNLDGSLIFEQVAPERIFGAEVDYLQWHYLNFLLNAHTYQILDDQLWIQVDDARALLFRAWE